MSRIYKQNKRFVEKQFEAVLDDRDVFVAYLLSSIGQGTNDSQLKEVLGTKGLTAIKTLIKKGYIVEKDGYYTPKKDEILIRTFESIKHHLTTYANFYNPSHIGQKRNYVHSLSGGLNRVGLEKAAEAHRRFHEEMQRIYREPNYAGNIPSFSVAFCDTFSDEIEQSHSRQEEH